MDQQPVNDDQQQDPPNPVTQVWVTETGDTVFYGPRDEHPRIVMEAPIKVTALVRRDNRYSYALDLGTGHRAELPFDKLEDPKKFNAWLSERCGLPCHSDKTSLPYIKTWLAKQPGASAVTHIPTASGWDRTHDIILGREGIIDARGVWIPTTADEPQTVVSRKPDGTLDAVSLIVEARKFGADMPTITEPYPVMTDPTLGVETLNLPILQATPIPVNDQVIYPVAREEALMEARGVMRQLVDALWANYGNPYPAMGLGYMLAHAAGDWIHRHEKRFPHLYLTGAFGAGKDVLASMLMDVAGGDGGTAMKMGGSTLKSVRNQQAANSLLPQWINELRSHHTEGLDEFIRTGYDRQGSTITNREQERVAFDVRRGFLLVGEVVVGAGAESSRYLEFHLPPVKDPKAYARVKEMVPLAKRAWSTLLCDLHVGRVVILKAMRQVKGWLESQGFADRPSFAWACAAAGLAWMLDPRADEDTMATLTGYQQQIKALVNRQVQEFTAERDVLQSFWADVEVQVANGFIKNDGAMSWCVPDGRGGIGIELSVLWAQMNANSQRQHDKRLIRNELKRMGADIGRVSMSAGDGADRRRAMVFRPGQSSLQLPLFIQRLAKDAGLTDVANGGRAAPEMLAEIPDDEPNHLVLGYEEQSKKVDA